MSKTVTIISVLVFNEESEILVAEQDGILALPTRVLGLKEAIKDCIGRCLIAYGAIPESFEQVDTPPIEETVHGQVYKGELYKATLMAQPIANLADENVHHPRFITAQEFLLSLEAKGYPQKELEWLASAIKSQL